MKKIKLLIPILAGLIVGQIFAEGDRPFTLINTLRFGYDDNVYRQEDAEGSAFVRDTLDFAFNAALSDRTDLVLKSRLIFRTDKENDLYPNLRAVLNHSVSPRLLLRFTEYFKSGTKTTGSRGGRYNYLQNEIGFTSTYVWTEKDRLDMPLSYSIRRHESEVDEDDSTTVLAGIFWERDIRPERTRSSLGLQQRMVDYDKRDSGYDATEAIAELHHTFSQNWQATVKGGLTYIRSDLALLAEKNSRVEPLFRAEVVYSPSPSTRINGSVSQKYRESDARDYVGQSEREYRLGIQHELTAKILAKANLRFLDINYNGQDSDTGGGDKDKNRMDLDFRLAYKVNRINFLEVGVRHNETEYSNSRNWDQNMIDLGWRVHL